MTKLTTIVASLALVVGALSLSSVPAHADSTFRGKIMNPDPANKTFTFVSDHMGTMMVKLSKNDIITDKDSSPRHFSDFMNGLVVKVRGNYSDHDKMFESVDRVIIQSD
ncbi:MAG: hypothetical protein WC848_01045 [Parcubacteria group bacterium]|jgi:hypothetical protein